MSTIFRLRLSREITAYGKRESIPGSDCADFRIISFYAPEGITFADLPTLFPGVVYIVRSYDPPDLAYHVDPTALPTAPDVLTAPDSPIWRKRLPTSGSPK